MKAPGIYIGMSGDSVVMGVRHSSRAEDKIWEAVDEAISAGMTVEQFRREAAQAWDYELEERRKNAAKEWKP